MLNKSSYQSLYFPNSEEKNPSWKAAGLRYYRLNHFFKRYFGENVWKVSVDAGFTCPNVDGHISSGGCIFCDVKSFSPSRRLNESDIATQISTGITVLSRIYTAKKFVAYFQPSTNTYAPVDILRKLYLTALDNPGVVGLVIGTRPDCVPDEVISLLNEISLSHWVSLELGIQSVHDTTLKYLNRGHNFFSFQDTVNRLRNGAPRVEIGAHVILGLPGESDEDMNITAETLAEMKLHSVKIHNLYITQHTPLANMYREGLVPEQCLELYVNRVVNFLERTPVSCVIDRICGNAPPEYLVAPLWCLNRNKIHQMVEAECVRRGIFQGDRITVS